MSKNRITVTTEAGRLTVTRNRSEVFRYFTGWELFWFTLDSPYHGLSPAELARRATQGEAGAIWHDFWNNNMWRHGDVAWAIGETILMAFLGTFGAAIIALPLAFAVTFAAGVVMERLVIRHLYHRPLETLLATFGISIALQQLAKNIFGTQARPLTSPAWLDGAWVISDVIQISYIRIAIFVLALLFLGLILFVLKRTRLGLEVRAVTQNPGMAASMGINPDRINMMTFGLGSGIAGIAGVAIGLYAKVTSEMGADYIVQSFMTVVVGGVGNVWGTLAGASLIGFLQKGIEWFNPSNTLAAQTYMVLFIILFIQFRPKGIVAQKGRAAAD